MNMNPVTYLCLCAAFMSSPATAQFFPPAPPLADTATLVVDLLDASPDEKLVGTSVQGLLNKNEARVYLLLAPWDRFWLDYLTEAGHIGARKTISLPALCAQYQEQIKAIIQIDPELPASINVATMMASVKDGIVVAPGMDVPHAAEAVSIDLTGRWQSNVEAYRWALDALLPRMNPSLLASYHPQACNHHLRDYLISRNVFHFWITSETQPGNTPENHAAERAFFDDVMAATPPNMPVLGFWYSGVDPGLDEYTGVGLAGEYGKITVVSDWATNLSFLGSITVDTAAAVQDYMRRLTTEAPALDPEKTYLCFDIVESGDAPSYVQSRQYEVWQDTLRGELPINWSLGPALFDLAPPIAAYFYNQATANDYIYMAISGAGYCHPWRNMFMNNDAPEQAWRAYIGITRQYLERMAYSAIGLYTDAWKPYNRVQRDAVLRRFADSLPQTESFILGMGRDDGIGRNTSTYFLDKKRDTIISHVMTRWPTDYADKTREENIHWLAQDIREHAPTTQPGFMHVMALSWVFGPAELMEVRQQLGDDFVPLTIPQFNTLFRKHYQDNEAE